MPSLKEFNERRRAYHESQADPNKPHPNGIDCECGKGLWDTNPMMTLTSNPPQKDVHCPACGFKGYRVA